MKKLFSLMIISLSLYGSIAIIILLSPRNFNRPLLSKIDFIILHTTEGALEGSLFKLRKNGEAHFLVSEKGQIYQLIEEGRVARHAGRTLWNGTTRLDENSLGIEIVGYHNKPITAAQELALGRLLYQMKKKYKVDDRNILPHSMVAYGVPNKWFDQAHRGRKRCGMMFADTDFRKRIGLGPVPSFDPDVLQGRLIVADPFLNSMLFANSIEKKKTLNSELTNDGEFIVSKTKSAWYFARELYNKSTTLYHLPNGQKFLGNQIKNWNLLPEGTRVILDKNEKIDSEILISDLANQQSKVDFKEIGIDGQTAYQIAGKNYASRSTIYFFPNGDTSTGVDLYYEKKELLAHLPKGTKVLLGYIYGGAIGPLQSAYRIAGKRWNSPATIYRLPNSQIITGDEVDINSVKTGTQVFFEL
ncbi:MAG: N-acetylmuramoyl-L-alanine amidase [Bdellovibrionaceae bacterium]|nr:N-acetylmuramoyl-L-alanine amidase [Pseudobdellovibrionaceae bacterium]NUM59677.1 N-acetylmuramoyl-L-alanine amidase [Pseudobdellovibrionaceae bacterium]